MKAARFYEVGKPLVIEEVPTPQPGPGEVLVKVKACGICGSDIHIVYEGVTPTAFQPIILGHEFSGEIAERGEGVEGWSEGDRVAVACIVSCGQCSNCISGNQQVCLKRRLLGVHLDGGLAEYAKVPVRNLARLTERIPHEQGAILTDAVATPYHAITRRGRLVPGETLTVVGCGGLGIHAVQLAKICGAGLVIAMDISEKALKRAGERGADLICRADRDDPVGFVKEATGGLGSDMAVECVGRQKSIALALECLRVGGRAVVVGLGSENIVTMPPTVYVRSELELRGSYGFTVREIEELIRLVHRGRLDLSASVSRTMGLDQVNEGLDALHKRVDEPIRIVLTM